MSLNPIPSSLRSSVGSKSTNAPMVGDGRGGRFLLPPGRAEPCPLLPLDKPPAPAASFRPARLAADADAARRAKVPRVHGTDAAAEAGDGAGVVSQNKQCTISTDESCTPTSISNFHSSFVVRRYGNLFGRRTAGFIRCKSQPPRIVYGDGGDVSVSGFGPFQVRSGNPGLSRGAEGSLRRDLDRGQRALGKGDYGHGHGGRFPLVRRMAHLGEALNGERGMLRFHVGRAREFVHDEEDELNLVNACFPSRRAPYVRNQVKLSPFFQLRPSFNSDYSIDRNKGIVSLSIDEGSTTIPQHQDPMMPMGHEHWRLPMPMSCFKSQDLVDGSPSRRAYEQNFSINPCQASSACVQHVTRSRGVVYHDGVDAAAPVRSFGNMLVKSPGKIPVCANEPEEPFSFWNMGKFNRRNTISSAPPTELCSNLGLKPSANFETSFHQKFTRLSNED